MKTTRIPTTNEKQKPKVCAYVRVSTRKEEQEYSFIAQSNYWNQKLSENREFEYIGLFSDEGISGKLMSNRKGLNEMLSKVRNGEISRVYTKSISRFARNYVETMTVVRELRDIGVPIIFEKENIDTLDPKCGLVLSVMASLAEEELMSMSKNQQWAARKRFANGSIELSRIYGYKYINGKLVINPEEGEVVKEIFKLYLQGNGVIKIAHYLDEHGYKPMNGGKMWAKSTVKKMLNNEKYIGDSLLQKNICDMKIKRPNRGELPQYYIEGSHEGIVSKEDFEKVQRRMKEACEKYHPQRNATPRYPLTGKVVCGVCDSTYRRKTCDKSKSYACIKWSCRLKDNKGKACCASNDIKDEIITKLLVDAYNECLDNQLRGINTEIENRKLHELLCAEKELKQLWVKGYISDEKYRMEVGQVLKEINASEQNIKAISNSNVDMRHLKKSAEFTKDIADFLVEATIKDWTVTFQFANGYETKRNYTNGRAGNVNGKLCRHKT